jgi:hypothetical protein
MAGSAGIALIGFGVFACSDSTGSTATCLNTLAGKTYSQDSIQFKPGPAVPASGTLELRSDTLYVLNLTAPAAQYDSGHYCLGANYHWAQNSFTGLPQAVGTDTVSAGGTKLVVVATVAGNEILSWFTQQP